MQVTPEVLNNPEAFKKFQSAQSELGGALSYGVKPALPVENEAAIQKAPVVDLNRK